MAYKFQLGRARLSGSTLFENGLQISGSGEVQEDLNIVKAGGLQLGGTPVTSTAAELNKLDGAGADVTATKLTTLSALTDAEIGFIDGAQSGAVVNSKVVVYSAGGLVQGTDFKGPDGFDIGNASNADAMNFAASEITVKDGVDFSVATVGGFNYGGAAVTSTAAELNLLDTAQAGTIVNGKAVIYSAAGQVSASALSSSGVGKFGGAVDIKGNLDVKGSVINFSGVSTAALDAADFIVSLDSATKDVQLRTRTNVVSDMVGTVADTALAAASGVMKLDIVNLGAEVIATGDTIVFNDSGDNGLHKESVDDLFKIGPALVDAAVLDTQNDHILFLDGGATGEAKKESMADLMASQAGTGVSVVGGKFTVDTSGGDRVSVAAIADGGTAAAGINVFANLTANAAVTLPAAPTTGDVVIIKAAVLNPGVGITISRAGSHTIDGETSHVLESPFGAFSCVYVSGSTGNDWRII